jgi:ribosomal protein S18 acetylase RimI-like enzyme
MTIERFGRQHAAAVAALHGASLSGLLAQLGPAALRAYYIACAESPLATAFVALDGSTVQGFVLGSTATSDLRRDVIRRNPVGVVAGIVAGVLRRPTVLRWLIRSERGPDSGFYNATAPELIYLAVSPGQRGRGMGRRLVDAFADAMRAAGQTRFELSVDESNREGVAFYERLGFARLGEYDEFGQRHIRYASPVAPPRRTGQ